MLLRNWRVFIRQVFPPCACRSRCALSKKDRPLSIPEDPEGHARIVREGGLPIAAGENLRSVWEFKRYIDCGRGGPANRHPTDIADRDMCTDRRAYRRALR